MTEKATKPHAAMSGETPGIPGIDADLDKLQRDTFGYYRWEGYDEALLLYVLGLGSPTHRLPEASYAAWTSTYRWERRYGQDYLYAGPLFTHQLSHVWVDCRGIQDAFMRARGIDYFENSRRATYVQQSTRSITRAASRNTALIAGASPQATAPVRTPSR